MAAISSSVADAYFKVGLVIEAGGIVVTVDEGRLDMHILKTMGKIIRFFLSLRKH